MRRMLMVIAWVGMAMAAGALPPAIEAGFRESSIFEGDGSIIVHGVDEKVFVDYVAGHWRWIMDHPEEIPERTDHSSWGRMGHAWVLPQACEALPPAEYVEFLNRWVDWWEAGVIPYDLARLGFTGSWRKSQFLAANSDDWRVRKLLKRMIAVTAVRDPNEREYLEKVLDGDYADHWEFGGGNVSDPRIPPETMPGSLPVFVFKHKLKRLMWWGVPLIGVWVWWRRTRPKTVTVREFVSGRVRRET